jgi:hypothetical protein
MHGGWHCEYSDAFLEIDCKKSGSREMGCMCLVDIVRVELSAMREQH